MHVRMRSIFQILSIKLVSSKLLRCLILFFLSFFSLVTQADDNGESGYFRPSLHRTSPRAFHAKPTYVYSSPGGNFKLYFHGYYQADFMRFGNRLLPDSANWRAGKTFFSLSFFDNLNLDLGYDFGTRKVNEIILWKDFGDHLTIDVGHISPIYAFLNSISTPWFSFLEVPLIENAFTPSYRVGTQWIVHYEPSFAMSFGVYRRRISYLYTGMRTSGILNLLYAPINEPRRLLVFNSAAWYQGINPALGSNTADFTAAPIASPLFAYTLVNGNVLFATDFYAFTEEVAGLKGPFSIIAGVNGTSVHRIAGYPSPTFGGYFILANYFLTGESRVFNLKAGSFTGITPITNKTHGAVELSVMYDYINLNSRGILGGIERDYGFSINYYPTEHCKFLAEYVLARATPAYNGINQTANIFALRIQTMW